MINPGVFLYESAISMAILYLFYWFMLRRETHFTLNRIILIFSLVLALVLPFLKISFTENGQPGSVFYILDQYIIDDLVVRPESHVSGLQMDITLQSVLWAIYLLGVLWFLVRFTTQIFQVYRMVRRFGIEDLDGLKIVPVNHDASPFSFMHLIFVNRENIPKHELKNILRHEREHVRRCHSIDIVLLELLCIFQWFNPFIWLYKAAIHEIHEYEADRGVINAGENKINYQRLILQQVFGTQFFQMVHHFIDHSLIKKRITMLTKREAQKRTLLKSLMIMPIAGLLVVAFSFTKVSLEPGHTGHILQVNPIVNSPEGSFIHPLPAGHTYTIGAPFGNMVDPFTKKVRHHNGIDISAPIGTSVVAVGSGKIDQAGSDETYGNNITIVHSNGFVSRYAHLDELFVQKGQEVNQGLVIGTVGNTGKSTNPHLHFEILKDGKYLDPLKVMSLNTDRLPEPQEDQRSQDTTRKIVVEEMPVFLGNESHDFKKFIVDHMKYPEQARKEKISGKVYIRFSVDEKGEVTDIEVVRSAHPVLDAEAVRIIGSSPAWKPGRNEGQPVKVSFTLPIEFNLDGRGEEGTNTPPIVTVVEKENKKPPIFYVVEEMPQFQGSTDIAVFQKWIAGQLKYPEEAAAKKAEGRVIVSFTVTQTGNVSNVKILRGADPLLDEEAIRVISSSPEWKPGKQRGVPVDVAMNLPINFVLGAEKPSGAER